MLLSFHIWFYRMNFVSKKKGEKNHDIQCEKERKLLFNHDLSPRILYCMDCFLLKDQPNDIYKTYARAWFSLPGKCVSLCVQSWYYVRYLYWNCWLVFIMIVNMWNVESLRQWRLGFARLRNAMRWIKSDFIYFAISENICSCTYFCTFPSWREVHGVPLSFSTLPSER